MCGKDGNDGEGGRLEEVGGKCRECDDLCTKICSEIECILKIWLHSDFVVRSTCKLRRYKLKGRKLGWFGVYTIYKHLHNITKNWNGDQF